MEGKTVASLDRNKAVNVSLPLLGIDASDKTYLTLDILVEGIGRDNSGSKFDLKGLVSQDVYLNGKPYRVNVCLKNTPCNISVYMIGHPCNVNVY